MSLNSIEKTIAIVAALIISIIFFAGLKNYPGQKIVYLLFSIGFNWLLFLGFTKKNLFFDSFIGIFLWLGFWLKLTIREIWFNGFFTEPVGRFNQGLEVLDQSLLISLCGAAALILAHYLRKYVLQKYPQMTAQTSKLDFVDFYQKHKWILLTLFVIFFSAVAILNFDLGIYQRGTASKAQLLPGLHGIFTWLLLFGLSSISAVFLDTQISSEKNPILIAIIALLETFCSSVSMLSRGFILNSSALLFGAYKKQKASAKGIQFSQLVVIAAVFIFLFLGSFRAVSDLRAIWFFQSHSEAVAKSGIPENLSPAEIKEQVTGSIEANNRRLFIDRWVGIEGVLSVASYPKLSFDLFLQALSEKYADSGTSFYDTEIAQSGQDHMPTDAHFINMAGSIGFFFYPGSFIFLFVCIFMIGLLASILEVLTLKMTGNTILCSLFAQVIAYRFAHFGYAPRQTYLLVGSVILNLLIIFFSGKLVQNNQILKSRNS